MKQNDLKNFIDIFEKNQKLPLKSKRKYIGFFLDFLRKIFGPIFEFFLAKKFETHRKATLLILKELEDLKIETKKNIENYQKSMEEFKENISKNFLELQKELLILRDEKIPSLKRALSLGLEGVDRKAEWSLSNLVVIRQAIEKGISLNMEEKKVLKNSLSSLNFMKLFRGFEEEIKKRQKIYVSKLKNFKKVVDLGCGRGEFLEILKENSISNIGIEKEPSLCAILKDKKLEYLQMDLFDFLEKKPFEFDVLTAFHIIEHLNLKEAIGFLKMVYDVLPSGGILILETPNPTSLFSFLNFYKDPEHKTPWHPETLKFFAENIGFLKEEEFYLQEVDTPENLNLSEEVKKLIYGPQDYGLILRKP